MDKRITEIKKGPSNIYPIGASASNITLNDGSILEEALGNINLAENGSIIDQIHNMAQSYSQIYAPIVSPEFQGNIKLKEGSNTVIDVALKEDNQTVNISIQGDLTVSGTSKLGNIQGGANSTSWIGDLPITGIFTSTSQEGSQAGIKIIDSGIGFTLQDLTGSDEEKNTQKTALQGKSATIRASRFGIYPGYDNNNKAKLYYKSNGIHSFMIQSNGINTEVATINNTGLDVNGKITCDSFSSPDTTKRLNINTLKTFVNVLTDYDTYPYGEPCCVRLYPAVTGYLRSGKTNETAYTAPGFMWKSGSADKPSMYLFYFSTAGAFWSSHVTCEKVGSSYKKFAINTYSNYNSMTSVVSLSNKANPAT